VFKNWRRAEPGDRVWVYYGVADGDLGAVGLATVRDVEPPQESGGRAIVNLDWDFDRTRRLLRNPYPAVEVRKTIPRPLGAMYQVGPRLARDLAAHAGTNAPSPKKRPKSSYGTNATTTISYTPPTKITAVRRHDAVLRPLMNRLETAGWEAMALDVGTRRVDLAMRRGRDVVLVEAKTVSNGTRAEVRSAFAQLSEYLWLFGRTNPQERSRVRPWALFEQAPAPDEIEFLEDHKILVTWADGRRRRFVHGPTTADIAVTLGLGGTARP
jgi:hypothetical protein